MAVPGSGQLDMLKLAREKVYDDYNSSSSITAPISMYDLVNGGNTNGSGHSYDTTNQQSASRPDTVTPHAMSEWRNYDHDASTLYISAFSPSTQHATAYHFGTTGLTHASKSAACASTNTVTHCVIISWNGTIGNGTVIKQFCGPTVAQDGVGGRWMKTGEFGSDLYSCSGSGTTVTDEYVFQISTSGVVSNFGTCLTSFSSSTVSNFNGVCLAIANQTYYHDGTGSLPAANDVVYSSSAGGSSNYLGAGYYRIDPLGVDQYIQVGSNGVVSNVTSCQGGGGGPP
jgi:hypothetical protein